MTIYIPSWIVITGISILGIIVARYLIIWVIGKIIKGDKQ